MHILIPAIVDIRKTAPNRLHHFIKHLSKKHEITIICINDFWKADQLDTTLHYKDFDETISKINIIYFTQKKISPILQEVLSPVFLKKMKNTGYDVIFNYNTLVSGLFLAKKFNIPMVYDIADDLPAMIKDSPQIPRPFRRFGGKFGEMMVKKTIAHSQAVTGIAEIFREQYTIPNEKFYLIPNGVNTDLFKNVNSTIKNELDLDNFTVLGYVGVLREWVDLSRIYHVLQKTNDAKLLVVGQEGLFKENKSRVKELGIENKVIFTGTIPYDKVPEYIVAMDICLIPFRNNEISQNAVPLKLFEYMACGKPVISSRLRGVEESVGNRIIYADTTREYEDILKQFNKSDPGLQQQLQDNRKFIENFFTWNMRGNSLETIINGVS